MNEVFRRRLIGLAVLLALMFALSLLLPEAAIEPGAADKSSTTVSLAEPGPTSVETEAAPTLPEPPTPSPEITNNLTPEPQPKIETQKMTPVPGPSTSGPKVEGPSLKLSPNVTPQPSKRSAPTVAPAPKPTPKSQIALAAPKPTLSESVAKPPPIGPPTSLWYVQIGSFSDEGRAGTILSLLQNVGYKGEVSKIVNASGANLYRVRLGVYATELAATQTLEKVARQGYPQARVIEELKTAR